MRLSFLEPVNVNSLRKIIFVGVITLRILKWGVHPGLSEWVLNNHMYLFKRKVEIVRHTEGKVMGK